MKIALEVWSNNYRQVEDTCTLAESLGIDALYYGESPHELNLDCWTTLASLARATERIRLGPVIANVLPGYRSSLLLARQAATVNHLSGGRVDFRTGVGASVKFAAPWWEPHGIDYPAYDQRLSDLSNMLEALANLLAGNAGHRPASNGLAIPITVAATGDRAMRLAATHADVWETSFCSPDEFALASGRMDSFGAKRTLRRSLEIDGFLSSTASGVTRLIDRVRSERGRAEDLAHVFDRALVGTSHQAAERLFELQEGGVDQVVVALHDPHDPDAIETLAEASRLLTRP